MTHSSDRSNVKALKEPDNERRMTLIDIVKRDSFPEIVVDNILKRIRGFKGMNEEDQRLAKNALLNATRRAYARAIDFIVTDTDNLERILAYLESDAHRQLARAKRYMFKGGSPREIVEEALESPLAPRAMAQLVEFNDVLDGVRVREREDCGMPSVEDDLENIAGMLTTFNAAARDHGIN